MSRPLVTVLIAEPHAIMRRGVKTLLESFAVYRIVGEVSEAEETLRLAVEGQPDIAVVADSFADMTGIELSKQIRQACPRTEILMHTNVYRESGLVAAQLVGVKGFVLKADPERNIIAALDALSLGRPYYSDGVSRALLERLAQPRVRASQDALTPRERQVIEHLATGYSNRQVGERIKISCKTVETHRAKVMEKLGLGSTADLVRFAIRNELVQV